MAEPYFARCKHDLDQQPLGCNGRYPWSKEALCFVKRTRFSASVTWAGRVMGALHVKVAQRVTVALRATVTAAARDPQPRLQLFNESSSCTPSGCRSKKPSVTCNAIGGDSSLAMLSATIQSDLLLLGTLATLVAWLAGIVASSLQMALPGQYRTPSPRALHGLYWTPVSEPPQSAADTTTSRSSQYVSRKLISDALLA